MLACRYRERVAKSIPGGVFMGGKRKENYDDWWRWEIRFEPELDEEFGVTHTKQGIRPSEKLRSSAHSRVEKIRTN